MSELQNFVFTSSNSEIKDRILEFWDERQNSTILRLTYMKDDQGHVAFFWGLTLKSEFRELSQDSEKKIQNSRILRLKTEF